jgi:hypothetical protein
MLEYRNAEKAGAYEYGTQRYEPTPASSDIWQAKNVSLRLFICRVSGSV